MIDLSKAVEAAADSIDHDDQMNCVEWTADLVARNAITAALPHILDALAAEFKRDAIFPDWDQVVAAALKYKAEEVRRG